MYKTRYREALFELDINLVDIEKKSYNMNNTLKRALNKLKKNYNTRNAL